MKIGDFFVFSFEGGAAILPRTNVAEITSIDAASAFFSCRQIDSGQRYTFQYSFDTSGPWKGSDDQGADWVIDTHDVYTAGRSDPSPGGVALIQFSDQRRYLCTVESVSPETTLTFLSAPFSQLSLVRNKITKSDSSDYVEGSEILSIERYVLSSESPTSATTGLFSNGWWSLARQLPAFPGRVGGAITPFATVVHTTDMMPETWDVLLNSWTTRVGPGDCAHFVIGRDATDGVVQLVLITHNANHAGGAGHGAFVAGAQTWHPNLVSVGIEVHCAGSVQKVDGDWRLVESGRPQGAAISDDDVEPDPLRAGRGWHKVTDYQYQQLAALLDALESVLGALPEGCVARSVERPPAYANFATGRTVGHVSLHAAQRGDPWPPTCDWMRSRS